MRTVILAAALSMVCGSAALAQASAGAERVEDGQKMVCKQVSQPNTRFKKKECHTKEYWELMAKVTREEFAKTQNKAVGASGN
jgi:Ni/Co efflux regulator RcnB